jgi:hypothetical protein
MTVKIRGLFPQTDYSLSTGALLGRTQVPPDPGAPLCAEILAPGADWGEVEAILPEPFGGTLRLRLPRDFENAAETDAGGDPLAWNRWDGHQASVSLKVWTPGGEPSHMTIGTGPDATQSDLHECRICREGYTLHILRFVLHDGPPGRGWPRRWVSAVLQTDAGPWLMASAATFDAESERELLSIAQSMRFSPRPAAEPSAAADGRPE